MKLFVGKYYNVHAKSGDNNISAVFEIIRIYSNNIEVLVHVENGKVDGETTYLLKPISGLYPSNKNTTWEEVPSDYDGALLDLVLDLGDKEWFMEITKCVDNV